MIEVLKLEITQQEAQIILNALIKQPYIEVAEVIAHIQQQASDQMQGEKTKP